MRAVVLELRRSRLWHWAAAATVLWVALLLSSSGQWSTSWTETRLWVAIPAAYLAPLIAAGAADVGRLRLASGHWEHVVAASRRPWGPWFAHVLSMALIALAPPVVALLVGSTVTSVTIGVASPVSPYFFAGVLFSWLMVILGYAVGTVLRSTVAAPLVAFVLGLVMALYGQPIPASARPWLTLDPSHLLLLGALTVLLTVAALLAVSQELSAPRRGGERSMSRGVAGAVVFAVALAVTLAPQRSTQVFRSPPQDVVCDQTVSGTRVCLWPEDGDVYLRPLLLQAERAEVLEDAFEIPPRDLEQPGLRQQPGEDVIVVEPLGSGAGLWFPAQTVAFALYNDFPACDPSQFSELETSGRRVTAWSVLDVMTGYIFGSAQPGQVIDANSDQELRAAAGVTAEVSGLPAAEQVAWLLQTVDQELGCE